MKVLTAFPTISTMTTSEVAHRFADLCRSGRYVEAVTELYAPDVVSIEPDGGMWPEHTRGYDRVLQKAYMFAELVERQNHGYVSEPVVAGEHFSISMILDVTLRGGGRFRIEGVSVHHVRDGLITLEHFFYPPMR
jgi:ketosteroid isomerase-like protein